LKPSLSGEVCLKLANFANDQTLQQQQPLGGARPEPLTVSVATRLSNRTL